MKKGEIVNKDTPPSFYAYGDFTVTFSEDFKSFEGLWSNDADEKKTKHGWGGKK